MGTARVSWHIGWVRASYYLAIIASEYINILYKYNHGHISQFIVSKACLFPVVETSLEQVVITLLQG
jgi:hypothetical protein